MGSGQAHKQGQFTRKKAESPLKGESAVCWIASAGFVFGGSRGGRSLVGGFVIQRGLQAITIAGAALLTLGLARSGQPHVALTDIPKGAIRHGGRVSTPQWGNVQVRGVGLRASGLGLQVRENSWICCPHREGPGATTEGRPYTGGTARYAPCAPRPFDCAQGGGTTAHRDSRPRSLRPEARSRWKSMDSWRI